jgi:hypothetical protein
MLSERDEQIIAVFVKMLSHFHVTRDNKTVLPEEISGKVRMILLAGVIGSPKSGHRSLKVIATEIKADWVNINCAALPYLDAMFSLHDITDKYYQDSGKSIVLYFLANARSWRGPIAKRTKAELKGIANKMF